MFVTDLVNLNGLERIGFKKWLFFPGMLFGSRQSWWDSGKSRPFTHEGLDVCFFEAKDETRYRLGHGIAVPMAHTGRIIGIIDDFIKNTIVCENFYSLQGGKPYYMLYAHVQPEPWLKAGDMVRSGQCIARIATPGPEPGAVKTTLPPHLHISVILQDALPFFHLFDWPYLNRLDRKAFLDPAPVAGLSGGNMQIMDVYNGPYEWAEFSSGT